MKRHATLAAFLVTVAIAVPAGWHALGASIDVDGKHLRPLEQTLMLDDGTKVTLDVDRSVVMTGDTVHVKLRAFAEKRKEVAIDLHALHTTNYAGERIERPWDSIDRETFTLEATPHGGRVVETAVVLGMRPDRLGLMDSFKIMITKHGTKFPKREFDVAGTDKRTDFESIEEGKAAAIAISGWSGNNLAISVEPQGKITANDPFTVLVRVKNTSGKKLDHHPWIELGTEAALSATDDPEAAAAVAIERIDTDSDDESDRSWKKGATYTQKFVVSPHLSGNKRVTFLARAFENDGLGPFGPGALDAKTFDVVKSNTRVAKK